MGELDQDDKQEMLRKFRSLSGSDKQILIDSLTMLQKNLRNVFDKFQNDCGQVSDIEIRDNMLEENKSLYGLVDQFTEIIEMLQD